MENKMGSVDQNVDAAEKRVQVVKWLNSLFPELNLPVDASEDEFRAQMSDGVVLCAILNKKSLGSIQSQRGVFISSEQRAFNLKRFLSAMDEMGLPRFKASDLEQGSISAVVDCLLSLREHMSSGIGKDDIYDATKSGNQQRKKWNLSQCDRVEFLDASQGKHRHSVSDSPFPKDVRRGSFSEQKFQSIFRTPSISELLAAPLHNAGQKFHEVFQFKQGLYSDLPAAKISEMMKSNSLDNAPTQSLLSVVNGILDESIERKNEEIPHRVACLLRKVVQEIERRISTQADHIRNQNNLIKAREEKYQSRIRVLETLASGTSEETEIVAKQFEKLKTERTKIEEIKKHGDQDIDKLMKEKEDSASMISKLEQELKNMDKLKKEKENSDRMTSELKQELKNMDKLLKEKVHDDRMTSTLKQESKDMDMLMKEKDNSDRIISELKQELENMDKLMKGKEANDCMISELKQELKNMNALVKEKENSDRIISELKQELKNMDKLVKEKENSDCTSPEIKQKVKNMDELMKEKENCDRIISELKQELKNMDKLVKEKENSDHIISDLKEELKNMDKIMKEKENSALMLSGQEVKNSDNLEKEKENSDRIISELKKELRNMDNLMKEKENSDRMISELKQELKNMDKLEKEKENSDCMITELKQKLKSMDKLITEKEISDRMILELKQELENSTKSYQNRCEQLEIKNKKIKEQLEERIKEVESLLAGSKIKIKELETISESKFQKWNKKELLFQNFIGSHLNSVKDMKVASDSIKQEVIRTQKGWKEEVTNLGSKLKRLVDAAENSHAVLAENRKLYNEVLELKGNIRVCCRIRPFLPSQVGKSTIIDHIGDDGEVLVANPSKQGKDGRRLFKFNKIFGPLSTQEQVYLDIQPLVRSVLDGFNVCIFAYGQTGSGKTYTMSGPNSPTKEEWGVNYRALNDLFDISVTRSRIFSYEVGVQMIEIYNEQVRDLLTSNQQKKLGILSSSQANGLAVPDASMLPVKSTSDVLELMQFGQSNRAMSSTALNERSSRSHSVVTIHVQGMDLKTGSVLRGCLHLIDLAGSERVNRSEVTGDRLKEAQHINKSLSALGDVIFALAQKSSHVPYRNSKLTQVLQSSLGGHAKTLMFVQVNPDMDSFLETVSTLKFAERVSGVELGAAKSSKEGKDVKDLMEQVASLKDMIARKDEEIEELQMLKDVRSPNGHNSLKHSASFSGVGSDSLQRAQRPSARRVTRFTDQASDQDNCSEFSDRYSENGSQMSVDDFKNQKTNGGEMGESFPSESDLLSLEDEDSEDRVSDVSDGGLETDNSIVESTVLPEASKLPATTKEKISRASTISTRIPKPLPQRTGVTGQTMSTRTKPKDPISAKTAVARKSTISQITSSLAKPLKR